MCAYNIKYCSTTTVLHVCAAEQEYLVMVVDCIARTITAADSTAGCRKSGGPLHGAARLLKGQRTHGLRCRVMDMVKEVMGTAVAVTVTKLGAAALLGGGCLQAARMGVAQGQVAG